MPIFERISLRAAMSLLSNSMILSILMFSFQIIHLDTSVYVGIKPHKCYIRVFFYNIKCKELHIDGVCRFLNIIEKMYNILDLPTHFYHCACAIGVDFAFKNFKPFNNCPYLHNNSCYSESKEQAYN